MAPAAARGAGAARGARRGCSGGRPAPPTRRPGPPVEPGPREVLVEVAAAGVNFMDIGVRRGMVWQEMPDPKVLGVEGAGRVLPVGDSVNGFAPGDRVAWVYAPGSYAEHVIIPPD